MDEKDVTWFGPQVNRLVDPIAGLRSTEASDKGRQRGEELVALILLQQTGCGGDQVDNRHVLEQAISGLHTAFEAIGIKAVVRRVGDLALSQRSLERR